MKSVNGQTLQMRFTQLAFGLCVIAFACIILSPNLANKIMNIAGLIAFFVAVFNLKNARENETFWLCLVLFVIGICDLIWYRLFKIDNSEAINSYRAYLEVGKICVSGAFLIYIFSLGEKFRLGNNKVHYLLVLILQVMMVAYAYYQKVYLGAARIEFSLAGGTSATGAAYTVVFLSCYMIMVLQHSTLRMKDLLILAHFFITFIIVVATETRAAIMVYPILFAGLLAIRCYRQRHIPWKGIGVLLFAVVVGAFMMKDSLMQRYHDLNSDMSAYEKNNTDTSVGARLAMWQTGLAAAKENYLWQSTDHRNAIIKDLVKKDPGLAGALPYIPGHLHNEVVEALSTKGPSGLLLYVLFVISLAWYALRKIKSFTLFAFLVAMMGFGLSGVMFYSKTTPTAWMLTLVMFIVFLTQNRHRDIVK